MNVHNLDKIFHPERIALIGVTPNPNSVSGKVLINLVGSGFPGVVYPVSPDHEAVLGITCFRTLEELPRIPDMAIICTAASQVPVWVKKCGEKGISGIIIMSSGFKETGEEGARLEEAILTEKRRYPGMRILGPNCLGIIVPALKLNASFAAGTPKAGNIAFISQSGALCTSVLDWALEGKIGFSQFVSVGNSLDIEFGDLIDYFGEDENTRFIILYIESIPSARKFMTAARAFARNKPIIVYKAGRFPESAKVAASHTGAMTSSDAVYDAAFERAGLIRVYEIGDIFNVTELIGRNKIPRGPNLGIITNAGGPGVMATDTLMQAGGTLARLSEDTIRLLDEALPPAWSHGNPVDVLGDARSKRIAKAAKIVAEDSGVDALLVILTPQAMTTPLNTAKEISQIAASSQKPILAAWLGGVGMREGIEYLVNQGIPVYRTPEQAIRAFMTLVSYSRNLQALYETPKDIRVEFTIDRHQSRERFFEMSRVSGSHLNEIDSKSILDAYGIPVSMPVLAKSAKDASLIAKQKGFPVVMKIQSPDIIHKSDAGGVILGLQSQEEVTDAFDNMMKKISAAFPDVVVDGVTIQPMVKEKDAVEMILGIKQDPVFGTVIMAGMGGVHAELFADFNLGLPPLNERLAMRMLSSLKIFPLLKGYRGSQPKNLDALVNTLIRLSYVAADFPEISELDINPLLVTEKGVIALDARIMADTGISVDASGDYDHLALHPYPEKLVQVRHLKNGEPVLLRPIKPEDEPLWLEMLGNCSRESLYSRFRYLFHWNSHDVATRYCYIDYDREVAIVAEIEEKGKPKLIGVGRLIADPDHETVEYAILITDAWQNRELGNLLTDYCLEIARIWKLKRLVAQTTTDNKRMVSVFRKRGFKITTISGDNTVEVEKDLSTP